MRKAMLSDAANIVVVALDVGGAIDTIGTAGGERDQDHNRHDANDDPAPRQSAAGVGSPRGLLLTGLRALVGGRAVRVRAGSRVLSGRGAGNGSVAALGRLLTRLRLRWLSAGRLLRARRLLSGRRWR